MQPNPLAALRHGILSSLAGACTGLLVVACGGSTDAADDQHVPLDEIPAMFAQAFCDTAEKCLGNVAATYVGADCVSRTERDVREGDFSLVQRAIDDGRITYNGTVVNDCVDAIAQAGCDITTKRLSVVCEGVLAGTVASGKSCTLSEECKSGLFCQTGDTCPGACVALLSAGQDCTDNDQCRDGLTCSGATRKCIAPAADGEDCGGSSAIECGFGLGCVGNTGTATGTCKALDSLYAAADGAVCDPTAGQLCETGLVCAAVGVSATGTLDWKCEASSTGAACHVGFPESCPDGQYCELPMASLEGSCKGLPGDGEPCADHSPTDASSTDALCAKNVVCVSGTCKAVQKLGGKCTTEAECFSKVCKDGGCAPAECSQ